MAQPQSFPLAVSAAVVGPGSGPVIDLGTLRRALRMTVRVTTFTAVDSDPTPALLVTIETRQDPAAPWRIIDTLSCGALGSFQLSAGGLDRYIRVSWALTNMVTVTFEASCIAHVVYCDPADITNYAVPEHSIKELSQHKRADACISATDIADGYIGTAYTLPLTAWGDDLRQQTAYIAAAILFSGRGFDSRGPDKAVADNRDMALKWLDRISNGRLSPPGIIDAAVEEYEGGAYVYGRPARGWNLP